MYAAVHTRATHLLRQLLVEGLCAKQRRDVVPAVLHLQPHIQDQAHAAQRLVPGSHCERVKHTEAATMVRAPGRLQSTHAPAVLYPECSHLHIQAAARPQLTRVPVRAHVEGGAQASHSQLGVVDEAQQVLAVHQRHNVCLGMNRVQRIASVGSRRV